MKVIIVDAKGNRIERGLSGLVTLDRIIAGPEDHMKVTVAASRVKRVRGWLKEALSTVQGWDEKAHVWFDVVDKTRDSARVPFRDGKFQSIGYGITNRTVLHVEANKPRSRRVTG